MHFCPVNRVGGSQECFVAESVGCETFRNRGIGLALGELCESISIYVYMYLSLSLSAFGMLQNTDTSSACMCRRHVLLQNNPSVGKHKVSVKSLVWLSVRGEVVGVAAASAIVLLLPNSSLMKL